MIRCILFDLDGTLLDTAPDLGYALNLLRAEQRLPPLPAAAIRPLASQGARGLLRLGFGLQPGEEGYEPLRQRFLALYRAHLNRHTVLFDGMADVLGELAQRALPWGIVTNKPAWLTEPLLAGMQFPIPPVCVVSGDSAAHPKPHPAPLLLACTQSGQPPAACLYVGDAQRDIESGRRAGMRTLAATYGYIEDGDDPRHWGADGLIDAPRELLAWLDGLRLGPTERACSP
ncbi:MAG TPA: HAD-IA family hydrolase [Nevskiales bacterium]|nr:HAD-IA family hydrolase [Nevskiales bacterium]